jgi:hypothetical protein
MKTAAIFPLLYLVLPRRREDVTRQGGQRRVRIGWTARTALSCTVPSA